MNEAKFRAADQAMWRSVGVSPSEQRLDLAGSKLSVRVQEVGEGPPVLFVHGASTCGTSWSPLIALLDGFRCITLDRPGCGLSDPLASGFTDVAAVESFADDLIIDVMDALDLERASLVATSLGGFYAIRAAAAHPGRVQRLVEIGWPVGAPIRKVPLTMRIAALPGFGQMMASLPATHFAVRAIFRQLGLGPAMKDGRIPEEMVDWFVAQLRYTDTMKNELKAGPRDMLPRRGTEGVLHAPALLAQIETPTRFLWGDRDPFGGETTATAFAAHFPNADLTMMKGVSHAPWLDETASVAEAVREFLLR